MAEKTKPRERRAEAGKKEITFRCRFCGRELPVKEIMVITRFFPPLVACRECERILS